MSEDRSLPEDILVTRLAVREVDGLRPIMAGTDDGFGDIAARSWQRDTDTWERRMQPGDELWSWSTPRWTWQNLCGRGGLAIVRNGKPIDYVLTVMN